MPGIVQLGPLVMASDRLLAVALMLAFLFAMDRIATRFGAEATRASGIALAMGIVTARLAYVAEHFEIFSRDWLSALAVWQGGFTAWAGFLGAALAIAWLMRPKPAMARALIALAALGLVWFGTSELLRPPPRPMPELPQLTSLAGEPLASDRLAGRPYVINLWATWCPPCRRELPMLAEAAREGDVPILLVNQGESAETVRAYLMQRGIGGEAVLLDPAAALTARLDSGALPTTLFVDGEGRIVEAQAGEISRAALADGIAKIGG